MFQRLDSLNERLVGELETSLEIGIGIHTGYAIVGRMGPPEDADHLGGRRFSEHRCAVGKDDQGTGRAASCVRGDTPGSGAGHVSANDASVTRTRCTNACKCIRQGKSPWDSDLASHILFRSASREALRYSSAGSLCESLATAGLILG